MELVVWVPKTFARAKNVDLETLAGLDPSHQFWDEGGKLMKAYQSQLKLPQDAWDIYFAFGPDAHWSGDSPPKPDFWMHQLEGVDPALLLDAKVFVEKASALAPSPSK